MPPAAARMRQPVALPVHRRRPRRRCCRRSSPPSAAPPPRLAETEAGFVALELQGHRPRRRCRPSTASPTRCWPPTSAEARRRGQEERAAALLAATKAGTSLAEAARAAGLGFREAGAITPRPAAEPDRAAGTAGPAVRAEAERGHHGRRPGTASRWRQVPEIIAADADLSRPRPAPMAQAAQTRSSAGHAPTTWRPSTSPRSAPAADVRINPRLVDSLARPERQEPPSRCRFRRLRRWPCRRAGPGAVARERVADLDTPVGAFLKLAARQAEHLPAGKRRGRLGARPLFRHRPGAGPDLALPRRPGRDQPPRPLRAARLRGGGRGRRWTACARHDRRPADAAAAGPAADRAPGSSAISATTWCG